MRKEIKKARKRCSKLDPYKMAQYGINRYLVNEGKEPIWIPWMSNTKLKKFKKKVKNRIRKINKLALKDNADLVKLRKKRDIEENMLLLIKKSV